MKLRHLPLLAVVVFALGACGSDTETEPATTAEAPAAPAEPAPPPPEPEEEEDLGPRLAGVDWTLLGLGGVEVPEHVNSTLKIAADGTAGGNGGCNRYSGPATIGAAPDATTGTITFGDMMVTKMFCHGARGEIETQYFATLATVASFEVSEDELTLFDAAGVPVLQYGLTAEQDDRIPG